MCLINGYDDIDYLISKKKLIKNFINQRWLKLQFSLEMGLVLK
jgi:hypothetical protein